MGASLLAVAKSIYYLNKEIEFDFTLNFRQHFSPVNTCYSCRVIYHANKQSKNQNHKNYSRNSIGKVPKETI